ncbi:unnamed protein product [Lampetra planeri]
MERFLAVSERGRREGESQRGPENKRQSVASYRSAEERVKGGFVQPPRHDGSGRTRQAAEGTAAKGRNASTAETERRHRLARHGWDGWSHQMAVTDGGSVSEACVQQWINRSCRR